MVVGTPGLGGTLGKTGAQFVTPVNDLTWPIRVKGFLTASPGQYGSLSVCALWAIMARSAQVSLLNYNLGSIAKKMRDGGWVTARHPILATDAFWMDMNDGFLTSQMVQGWQMWCINSRGDRVRVETGDPTGGTQFVRSRDVDTKYTDPNPAHDQSTPISAAQYMARQHQDILKHATYDAWDGWVHDWWRNIPFNAPPDFNQNDVADSAEFDSSVILQWWHQTLGGYIAAYAEEWRLLKGELPYIFVNTGAFSSTGDGKYLEDKLTGICHEQWIGYYSRFAWLNDSEDWRNRAFGGRSGLPHLNTNELFEGGPSNLLYAPVGHFSVRRTDANSDVGSGPNAAGWDPYRTINAKNIQECFIGHRFNVALSCVQLEQVGACFGFHQGHFDLDEFQADLGGPTSDSGRLAIGTAESTRLPAAEPTWPPDGTDFTNLYGSIVGRAFHKGMAVAYLPKKEGMTTVKIGRTELQQLGAQFNLPPYMRFYRLKGNQAFWQSWVWAGQVPADNEGYGATIVGSWSQTAEGHWVDPSHLFVLGKRAYFKQVPSGGGASGATITFQHEVRTTDDRYDLYLKMPIQGFPDRPNYLDEALRTQAYLDSNVPGLGLTAPRPFNTQVGVTVQHDDGGGTPTTTSITVDISELRSGIRLENPASGSDGLWRLVGGTSYTIEIDDSGDGESYTIVEGIYCENRYLPFQDGTEITDADPVVLFGGLGGARGYKTSTDGNIFGGSDPEGDGFLCRFAAPTAVLTGGSGIVGGFAIIDTDPGQREALRTDGTGSGGNVWERYTPLGKYPSPGPWSNEDRSGESPWWCQLNWGQETFFNMECYAGWRIVNDSDSAGAMIEADFICRHAGRVRIYEWHGWMTDSAGDPSGDEDAAVAFTVAMDSGTGTPTAGSGTIDQSGNYGQWNVIDTVTGITAGSVIRVTITPDSGTGAAGYTMFDALRFEYY